MEIRRLQFLIWQRHFPDATVSRPLKTFVSRGLRRLSQTHASCTRVYYPVRNTPDGSTSETRALCASLRVLRAENKNTPWEKGQCGWV